MIPRIIFLSCLNARELWNPRWILHFRPKSYVYWGLFLGCLFDLGEELGVFVLFLDVSKVYNPLKTYHLVHMVNAHLEVMLFFKPIDTLMISTRYVLLKFKCNFIAEVPLYNVRERVR